MKKHYLIVIAAAALSIGLASCSQSEDVADGTSAKQTITFTSGDDDTTTRTSMGGNYTDSKFPFYWETGDKIYTSSDNWTTAIPSSNSVTSHASRWNFMMGVDGTAATYPVRYTGTGTYTSNNHRDATYSFTTNSDANTLVIPPLQTIATWAEGADTKRIGANGDCGTATATGSGTLYNFKLNHQAAYLILMPRWGTGGTNITYKLKSVTVTTHNSNYLLSGRFSFSDTGIGSVVTNTKGSPTIKITTGGSEGLTLPTSKDQTKSINIAIKPVVRTLYCIYEVSDGTNTYYIEKIVGSTTHGGTLTSDKLCIANTITPITADIKAGYDLASKDGYLDLITNKNPYSGFYEWDAPNGEEYFVSHEMGDDYNAIPVPAGSTPTAAEGARTDWCTNSNFNALPTYNQMTWYLQGGCYWQADKKWGTADNQKGGMWFKKKAYLISSGVVASETAFNTTQSGTITANPVTTAPADFNTSDWFFLPAAGDYVNGTLWFTGTNGYYWSSTPSNSVYSPAFSLTIGIGRVTLDGDGRLYGFCLWSVR